MIESMLVLSTAHLTEETCNQWLPENAALNPIWDKGEYGWFVYVFEDTCDIPTDLEACLHLAQSQKCYWLMLDRDGPVVLDLPTFEW